MKSYLQKRAVQHEVQMEFIGKHHYYTVRSPSKKQYNVAMRIACDCAYMGIVGDPNGKVCSHILAVLMKLVEDGGTSKQVQGNHPKGQTKS